MKIIDLLVKIANGEEVPKYIQYYNMLKDKTDTMMVCKENIIYKLDQLEIQLNSRVEILEEENELHANSVEFNINNDKRDCVITLDENDLGIDKLHLDNCYFYKENDKWYVKKYDFKSFKLEEEKKIPEKLEGIDSLFEIGQDLDLKGFLAWQKANNKTLENKINSIIDYLKSKGE